MTPVEASPLAGRLREAVRRFDGKAAESLCRELVEELHRSPHPMSETEADAVLTLLLRSRRFDLLARVADALQQVGVDAPLVRRYYAQALLDQDLLSAGLAVLGDIDAGASAGEAFEARGLVGRAYKEMFLVTSPEAPGRRMALLERSVAAYESVFLASAEHVWHGVNAAALLLRADRDAILLPGHPDAATRARTIAGQVVATVTARRESGGIWDKATLVEAHLVLGQVDDALACLRDYLSDPGLDAFELGSLHRQLVEVWQLRPDRDPGTVLLPSLAAMLLSKQGGNLTVGRRYTRGASARSAEQRVGFEKVFGGDGLQAQRWFEDLLMRCRAVAQICDSYEEGLGTGFLVDGSDLHPSLPAVVLVTNAHVVPDAVRPEDAVVTFRGLPTDPGPVRVRTMLWGSPAGRLDVTLLELDAVPEGAQLCAIAPHLPALDAQPPNRVYVIGHPQGAPSVKISIQDNHLLDYDDVRVHYRAPTQPGSSGSPVFDRRWNVVALHHAGSEQMSRLHGTGTYQANEGIRIDRIRQELAAR